MTTHVVILAAGQGTRMVSRLPKVLHKLAGKTLLNHLLTTAVALKADKISVVLGHQAEQVRQSVDPQLISHVKFNWLRQQQQLGTGHAVKQAIEHIKDNERVVILYADVPLVSQATLAQLAALATADQLGLVTLNLTNPQGYGRIVRNTAGQITAIVEERDASKHQRKIEEINTGMMAIQGRLLKGWLTKLTNNNAQQEYYLTDIIALACAEGVHVCSVQPAAQEEVAGVNNRQQLAVLERYYQAQQAENLMLKGITLADPQRFDLRGELVHGQDVTIDVNVIIEGQVSLGTGVIIGPNVHIKNAHIADHVTIKANSVIEDSHVGAYCEIGPFARLRPGTQLAEQAKVGNFVETKQADIGRGSKINHLSYVGDAVIGQGVNIGAGTITCNYDGANKHQTQIADDVFVGSNSALVAPLTIGKQATVGAGSTLTKSVPAKHLAVARNRQAHIKDWQRPTKLKPE
jgi:bifunctional UDP-N-acetylglucosamine pyrophosphorylase/glucosamine-1-phosphate N-acetyltransferase